jgi:hypothetical protein
MIELEKGKTDLQLPEELAQQLPEEITPQILAPFEENAQDPIYTDGWEIIHFLTENEHKIICLFHREKDSIEVGIVDELNNVETRMITKISRNNLGKLERTVLGTLYIDKNENTTLFSDQNPSDLQP